MAKKKMNPLEKVAKRFGVTAREARDIATAVSTLGRASTNKDITRTNEGYPFNQLNVTKRGSKVGTIYKGSVKSKAARNIAKQVGEVYTAATKGKSGTKSAQLKSRKDKTGRTVQIDYALETKRKQGKKK
jgi:hypothetical protein